MAAVRPRAWHRGPDECPHTASKSEAIWPPLTRQITHAAVLIRKNVYLVFGMHQTLATQHLLPTTADGALGPRLRWPVSPLDHSELAAAQGPSSTQDGLPPSRPRVAPSSAQAGGRPVPCVHHGKRRLAADRLPSLPVPCTSPSSPPQSPGSRGRPRADMPVVWAGASGPREPDSSPRCCTSSSWPRRAACPEPGPPDVSRRPSHAPAAPHECSACFPPRLPDESGGQPSGPAASTCDNSRV